MGNGWRWYRWAERATLASARPLGVISCGGRAVRGGWRFERREATLASWRGVSDGRAQPCGTVRKDRIPSRRAGGTSALRGDDCRRVGRCCPRLACPSSGRCYGWSLIPSRPQVKRRMRLPVGGGRVLPFEGEFALFSGLFSVGGVLSSLFAPIVVKSDPSAIVSKGFLIGECGSRWSAAICVCAASLHVDNSRWFVQRR